MEFKTTLNLGRTSVTERQAVPEGVWMKASIKVSIDPIAPIDAEFTAQAKQAPVKSRLCFTAARRPALIHQGAARFIWSRRTESLRYGARRSNGLRRNWIRRSSVLRSSALARLQGSPCSSDLRACSRRSLPDRLAVDLCLSAWTSSASRVSNSDPPPRPSQVSPRYVGLSA